MIKRLIFTAMLFCLSVALAFPQTANEDESQNGPAAFYYTQHEEEPWRFPKESTHALLLKSVEAGAAAFLLFGYLYVQKRKT